MRRKGFQSQQYGRSRFWRSSNMRMSSSWKRLSHQKVSTLGGIWIHDVLLRKKIAPLGVFTSSNPDQVLFYCIQVQRRTTMASQETAISSKEAFSLFLSIWTMTWLACLIGQGCISQSHRSRWILYFGSMCRPAVFLSCQTCYDMVFVFKRRNMIILPGRPELQDFILPKGSHSRVFNCFGCSS